MLGRDFLSAHIASDAVVQTRLPDVDPADLQAAWHSILQRARLVQHHTISREQLSVREHMTLVLRRLQGQRFMEFESLFEPGQNVAVVVVMFVAILELAKEAMVQITQAESFAPIYLRLAHTPADVLAAD